MKERQGKTDFQLYYNGLRRVFGTRVRRWAYRHHIRRANLAFDLIALRGEMRFDGCIKIRLFNRLFSGFSDVSCPLQVFAFKLRRKSLFEYSKFMTF